MMYLLHRALDASLVLALSLGLGLAMSAQASAEPGVAAKPAAPVAANPAEVRLEALRQALMEQALQAPLRVRAAAWVDERGMLRESVQLNSEMQLRGVRVLSYIEESGTLKAEVVTAPARPGTEAAAQQCLARNPRLRRHAALLLEYPDLGGRQGYFFLPQLAERARQGLIKAVLQDSTWVLTPNIEARSAYEAALMPVDAPRITPYVLHLGLQELDAAAAPAAPKTLRQTLGLSQQAQRLPAKWLRLSLRLVERGTGRLLWAQQAPVEYPATNLQLSPSPLPASLIDDIERTLDTWRKAMAQALACEPLQFALNVEAGATGGAELTIFAGARAGLRVGDQLLLVDRSLVPAHMLEAGALDKSALLQVQSVTADSALAKRIAGPAPVPGNPKLVAMPL